MKRRFMNEHPLLGMENAEKSRVEEGIGGMVGIQSEAAARTDQRTTPIPANTRWTKRHDKLQAHIKTLGAGNAPFRVPFVVRAIPRDPLQNSGRRWTGDILPPGTPLRKTRLDSAPVCTARLDDIPSAPYFGRFPVSSAFRCRSLD